MIETLLRIQINVLCLILLGFSYNATAKRPFSKTITKPATLQLYHFFIGTTSIMLITDMIGWMGDGRGGRGTHVVLIIAYTLYYATHSLPVACYILYAQRLLHAHSKTKEKWRIPLWVVVVSNALLSLLSPVTGWFFHISADNVYTRGDLFPFFAITQFALLAISFIPILSATHKSNRRTYWTLVFFPVIASIGGLIQIVNFGLVIIWPVATVFLIAAALNIQKVQINIDYLTGIHNRLYFDETLEKYIRTPQGYSQFGCILMDLDRFKNINDSFGHEIGDQALEDVAQILTHLVEHHDVVARYGGDEFAILLPCVNQKRLMVVVQGIEREIMLLNQSGKRAYTLSISMGYAIYDASRYKDVQAFISHIDKAMYAHKRSKQQKKEEAPLH